MTKAATKAKRRRRKGISLPGGKTAPRRVTQGRRTDLQEPPTDAVALAVRARLTGCTVEDARDVLAGEDLGRCILAMRTNPQDRRDLLTVWQGISAAWWNYSTRCLSLTPSAQSSSLPMLPEPMQTDQSLRIDPRTGEEKDEAARRVWDGWEAAFRALPLQQALIIANAARDTAPCLWNIDRLVPTRHGALAVAALAALHKRQA